MVHLPAMENMNSSTSRREQIIEQIVEKEYKMFESLRARDPNHCKDNPKTFKLIRGIYFSFFSDETLWSYLKDLEDAEKFNRNLLEEKYARMDDLIPKIKENPLIEEIVTIRLEWMRELSSRYPNIFQGNEEGFAKYLRSELETYSDRTLELVYRDLQKAIKDGRNILREQYELLFRKLGYNSLEEVERRVSSAASSEQNMG